MKKIFAAVVNFLHFIFGGAKNFATFVETHVDDAIEIGNKIKALISNPVITNILDILPDKVKTMAKEDQQKLLDKIETAIDKLAISQNCLSLPTLEEKLTCFLQQLRNRSELDANGTIQKLVSAIVMQADNKVIDGAPITENMADNLVVNRLTEQKNAEAIANAPDTSQDEDENATTDTEA